MNKWGVRLIGLLFLIEAIDYSQRLITKIRQATGFWGLDLVYAIIFLYAGIQLLRFHPSGRNWALFILWVATVFAGIFLFQFIVQVVTSQIHFANPQWLNESSRPIFAILVIAGIIIIFCLVPIYLLMRKDVKQLFEKPVATEESTNIIQGAKS